MIQFFLKRRFHYSRVFSCCSIFLFPCGCFELFNCTAAFMYTEAKLSAEVHHRNRYPFLKYPFQKVGSRKSEFGSLKSEVRSLKSEV